MRRISSHLTARLVVGMGFALLVLLAIASVNHERWAWFFLVSLTGTVVWAQWEYYELAEAKGHHPYTFLGLATTVAYLLALFATAHDPSLFPLEEAVLLISLMLLFAVSFFPRPDPLVNVALTLFGVGYLALTLGSIVSIAYFPFKTALQSGPSWLLYLFAVTKITDVGALGFGKLYGKHRLAQRVSPNKTIEGALGGLFTAVGLSLLLALLMPSLQLTVWQGVWLGTLMGIVSQLGDLSESVLKRDANVKNSSRLPGLGGILDVVDSLVFTAPLLLFFLRWGHF